MTRHPEPLVLDVCRACGCRLAVPSPAIVRHGGRRREFCGDRCRKAAHRRRVRAVRLAFWRDRARDQGEAWTAVAFEEALATDTPEMEPWTPEAAR